MPSFTRKFWKNESDPTFNPLTDPGLNLTELNRIEQGISDVVTGFTSFSYLDVVANENRAKSRSLDVTQGAATLGTLLTIPTGYAGNDVVEPAVLYDSAAPFFADANGANGYEYVLCVGGYSLSNALYENPNLWVSHDGTTWVYVVFSGGIGTPTPGYGGVLTPVVPSGVGGDGTISDPYLVRGADGYFYLLWNQFLNAGGNWGIKGCRAANLAGPWSTPVTLVAQSTGTRRDSSPSALWDGTQWHIYGVELHNFSAPTIFHYTAADLLGTWTLQAAPSITIPAAYNTRGWWHLNAYRWGSQHILVVQDNVLNSLGPGNLWLVSSSDGGATWTVPGTPFMTGSFYRSAFVVTERPDQVGLDHFYGTLTANWALNRNFISLVPKPTATYGGVALGVPVHATAVAAARVPLAPFLFGDAVIRADSAATPGSADSGQSYTVSTGTVGVAGHALYCAAAAACRAGVVVAGAADGVYACRFKAVDSTVQNWFIARYKDSSNYIRIGNTAGNPNYLMQNIVGGGVSQTLNISQAVAAGDVLALLCVGSTVTVFVNGIAIGQATGWTSNQAESGIGVQFSNISNHRTTDLYMRALIGGS